MRFTEGLVSVIIPVFNRESLIEECLKSVSNQTDANWEIVVIDDGSTDGTLSNVEKFRKSIKQTITVISIDNQGPGVARETGRRLIKGEFVQYLDSDDLLLPRKFELQKKALRRDPSAHIAYCKTRYRDVDGIVSAVPVKETGINRKKLFPSILKSRWWDTSTPLYRREVVERAGAWLPLWNEEDWEYDTRMASLDVNLVYCDEYLSETRIHSGERLSSNSTVNRKKMISRAKAHEEIVKNALSYRVQINTPEMKHMASELFLLSRQCAALNLEKQAVDLLYLSKKIETRNDKVSVLKLYSTLSKLLGWQLIGRLSIVFDRIRRVRINIREKLVP